MKKRYISLICIIISALVVFSSCGKNGDDTETTVQSGSDSSMNTSKEIALPYSSSDSLNPFFASGVENSALAFIYCQPLFTVKSDYSIEAVLADSYNTENTTVTVFLKSAVFSDSSTIKTKDVVYSFNKAKASSFFSQRLVNVTSAKQSGNSVIFTLASADAYSLNILSFPIVKEGTADKVTDIPVGSGAYVINQDKTITPNKNNQSATINSIKLNDIKKLTYITNELEIGNINYLFENFSDGNYERIVAQNKSVMLNNFVYLGMNSSYGALSSSAVRTAVYYAIDKQSVSATAYQGYAKATATPFNPDFYELKDIKVPDVKADNQKCVSILEKTGFSRYTKTGARTNGTNTLQFTVLVNYDNVFRKSAAYKICENLCATGIQASVEEVSSDVYQQRIASGNFQMYVGEVKIAENMDLSVFSKGSASAGINLSEKFFTDYNAFREGTIGIQEITDSFMDCVVIVPICYRAGMAAFSKSINPDFSYAQFIIYSGVEKW